MSPTATYTAVITGTGTSVFQAIAEMRDRYEQIYACCATTPGRFVHQPGPRKTAEVAARGDKAFVFQ